MRLVALFAVLAVCLQAGSLNQAGLQADLERLTKGFDGRVGVCVLGDKALACARGAELFSIQSVMKMIVGMAVLDAVDNRGWKLDESLLFRKQDLSVYQQPIAALIGETGYRTTVGDLVRRAIVDSDSAAVDYLIAKLGGIEKVQAFLTRKRVIGLRVDRDERRLQTEIVGIAWEPEFIDAALFEKAIAAVPDAHRSAAYEKYRTDKRDTSTPTAMVKLLRELAAGRLLSKKSTAWLLDVMEQTATGPDRLKAGLAKGWRLAHKTGSSGSWQGFTVATNDVGILFAPDGGNVAVAVFVADTHAELAARAGLMASIASAIRANYQP